MYWLIASHLHTDQRVNVRTFSDEVKEGGISAVVKGFGHAEPGQAPVAVAFQVRSVELHGQVDGQCGGLDVWRVVDHLSTRTYVLHSARYVTIACAGSHRLDWSARMQSDLCLVLSLRRQVHPQPGVGPPCPLPHALVCRRAHGLRVAVCGQNQVAQFGQVAQALYQVFIDVVRADDQRAQIDETGHSQQGEGLSGRVGQVEVADLDGANLADFVKEVRRCKEKKVALSTDWERTCLCDGPFTVDAVQLEVDQLQPLEAG